MCSSHYIYYFGIPQSAPPSSRQTIIFISTYIYSSEIEEKGTDGGEDKSGNRLKAYLGECPSLEDRSRTPDNCNISFYKSEYIII